MGNAHESAVSAHGTIDRDSERMLDRLVSWRRRVEAVMEFYDRSTAAPSVEARHTALARTAYSQLKDDLRRELKRMQSEPPAIRSAEERWYAPAIADAVAHVGVSTGTRPERWFSSLCDAQTDFEHAVRQMRRHFDLADTEQDREAADT